MSISSNKYKQMSIKEFTKAAKIYDSGKSGIYEICKYDYPKVLTELKNTKFIVGDCENLPFEDESYDVIICTNSFHHYPNPQDFFDSVYRVLRKGGRLILRDYTSSDLIVWLMNHIELPLAHLVGHGDVKIYKKEEYREMLKKAGFRKMKVQAEEKFRCHIIAVKL